MRTRFLLILCSLMIYGCDSNSSSVDHDLMPDINVNTLDEGMMIELEDMSSPDMMIDQAVAEEPNTQALLEELYRWDRILNVSLVLDPTDWDSLRSQTRSWVDLFGGEDCLAEPFSNVFTWFEASATIDGEYYPSIDVRKKGFLGSLSETKPSLKLDLGEYISDQTHLGARRFTLNNSVQDPAFVRQCLAYELSIQAGIPAPRCNFALVDINGVSLGLYLNIEPYKRSFFEANFGSYDGNLYEGTVSDFTENTIGTFEAKNNDEDRPVYDEIMAIYQSLEIDDDSFITSLEQVINMEQFLRFWALESLLLHSDGYSGNRNNYYLYSDPSQEGKMTFLLWGVDGVLNAYDVAEDQPKSVYLKGILAWRLYQLEEWRTRYFNVLDNLLSTLWNEDEIIDRVNALEQLLSPLITNHEQQLDMSEAIDDLKLIISERRQNIEEERSETSPESPERPDQIGCLIPNGSVRAQFRTEWGMINRDFSLWFEEGEQELELSIGSTDFSISSVASAAGTDEEYGSRLNVVGALGFNKFVWINVSLDEENWQSGQQEVWSEIYYSGSDSNFEFVYLASSFINLNLESGEATEGSPIIGTLSGDVLSWSEE